MTKIEENKIIQKIENGIITREEKKEMINKLDSAWNDARYRSNSYLNPNLTSDWYKVFQNDAKRYSELRQKLAAIKTTKTQ